MTHRGRYIRTIGLALGIISMAMFFGVAASILRAAPAKKAPKNGPEDVQNSGADPDLKLVSKISDVPNTPDPKFSGKGSDLFWLCDVRFAGKYVLTIGRNGWFCTFDRDPATAELKLKSSCSGPYHRWDWYNLATKELADHSWVVYCTHAADLDWYKLNPTTGALEWQEHLAVPRAAYPFMTPDKSRLILAGSAAAVCASLDPQTGKATILSHSKCMGMGGTLSPDGKDYYSVNVNELHGYSINDKDGSLTQICKLDVPDLDTNRWAWLAVSPNGKFVYRPTGPGIATLDRDPATGIVKYKEAQTIDKIACVLEMLFNPDGRSGYCVCMGEGCKGAKSSNCTGAFAADPETGKLTYVGEAPKHGGYTRLELDPVHGNLLSLIKLGPSMICSFKTPDFPAVGGAKSAQAAPMEGASGNTEK